MGPMLYEGTPRNLRHPLRNTRSLICWLLGVMLLAACGSGPTSPASPPDSSLGVYFTGFTTAGVIGPLYALDASDGTLRWKIQVHPDAQAQPLLAKGILYLREATGGVSAFKASDGTRLWHQDLGHAVVVNTVANGVVYGTVVAGLDPRQSSIFALNASNGKMLWESPQAGGTLERVADGVVYVGFASMSAPGATGLSALSASDGALLWHYQVSAVNVNLFDVVDGQAYLLVYEPPENGGASIVGFLAALDSQTGGQRWRFPQNGGANISELGATDQTVYALSNDGQPYAPATIVYALHTSDGSVQWRRQTPLGLFATSHLEGGTLYLGSGDGVILAMNTSDGSLLWQTQVAHPQPSDPFPDEVDLQMAHGLLYATVSNNGAYLLKTSDGSVLWHTPITGTGPLLVLAATSTSLYVSAQAKDGKDFMTALKSSDGSVRWTYSGIDQNVNFAAVG
ncbi:MAG TPA: PQQ-binding-like beta-propeller repeat protein [Ktedonobacterales bacterium]|nr:PQQ-binding-like beta-propeller repeat protein [Ktedonobacterales bacterium]